MRSNIGEYISAQHSSTMVVRMLLWLACPMRTWNLWSAARCAGVSCAAAIIVTVSAIAAISSARRKLRRERRDLRLDGAPRRDQLERRGADALEQAVVGAVGLRLLGDEGAGADPHLDQAGDLERDHRLAHGRAAHAQQPGEVTLRRQPVARLELAPRHQVGDLAGDLLIKSLRRDGLKRHTRIPPPAARPGRLGRSLKHRAIICSSRKVA